MVAAIQGCTEYASPVPHRLAHFQRRNASNRSQQILRRSGCQRPLAQNCVTSRCLQSSLDGGVATSSISSNALTSHPTISQQLLHFNWLLGVQDVRGPVSGAQSPRCSTVLSQEPGVLPPPLLRVLLAYIHDYKRSRGWVGGDTTGACDFGLLPGRNSSRGVFFTNTAVSCVASVVFSSIMLLYHNLLLCILSRVFG